MKIELEHSGQKGITAITCTHAEAFEIWSKMAPHERAGSFLQSRAPVWDAVQLEQNAVFFCCESCLSAIQQRVMASLIKQGVKVTLERDQKANA